MRSVATMTTSDEQKHPKRMLGGGFALAVIVGGTIGMGILRTPGEIAAVVPDPVGFVSLWVVSGLFILLSAVVVAISWPVYRALVRSRSNEIET